MSKLFHINRYFGWSIVFRNGFSIGFNWTWSQGHSSRTSASVMSYHPPSSITWIWALYWNKPKRLFCLPSARWRRSLYGYASIDLPLIGGLSLSWQPRMDYKNNGAA